MPRRLPFRLPSSLPPLEPQGPPVSASTPHSPKETTAVVVVALVCNLGIAGIKFAAAVLSGSSAMLSEAIHSLVDTANQGLLLTGIKRAARPADAAHPFGYGRELYFWSFVVAILLFSLGAGLAIYEGVDKMLHPQKIENVRLVYAVLAAALALEGVSTWRAVTAFNSGRSSTSRFLASLRASKDPALYTVLLEDLAALAGLAIALTGVLASEFLSLPQADGAASIAIGIVLALVAAFMSVETKGLLIGEAADPEVTAGINALLAAETAPHGPITRVNSLATSHLGPDDILAAVSADFDDAVTARDVEATNARLERAIKAAYPAVRQLYLAVRSDAAVSGSTATFVSGATASATAVSATATAAKSGVSAPAAVGPAAVRTAAVPVALPAPAIKASADASLGPGAKPLVPALSPARPATAAPAQRQSRKGKKRAKHRP